MHSTQILGTQYVVFLKTNSEKNGRVLILYMILKGMLENSLFSKYYREKEVLCLICQQKTAKDIS